MAAESSTAAGSGQRDLDVLMEELGLKEDDLDDVIFEDEDPPPPTATRWMAIARVHTEKEYSKYWFYKNMRSAWDLAQEVKIRSLENNLYTFQFSCIGDWEKVMEGGPWTNRGCAVVLAPYDGFTKPSSIQLNHIAMWIQIHDLPDGFACMLKSLAGKVGKYVVTETPSLDFSGNFYRVRVEVDVRKPLRNHVSLIRGGERLIFRVKYERLPDWCSVCGMLGHVYKEHGDGLHPPKAMIFKGLKAEWSIRPPRAPSGQLGSGRGGGCGNYGNGAGRGSSSGDGYLRDNISYAENESDVEMNDGDLNRKRGATTDGHTESLPPPETVAPSAGNLVIKEQNYPPAIPPSPLPKRDPKRVKKGGETEAETNSDKDAEQNIKNTSAGLFAGHRREQ